jgi:hypothetical protein
VLSHKTYPYQKREGWEISNKTYPHQSHQKREEKGEERGTERWVTPDAKKFFIFKRPVFLEMVETILHAGLRDIHKNEDQGRGLRAI